MLNLQMIRNIGISAHIDSGKTTLTERILFYTKRIHRIHEVKGKDEVGATMDFMELERERGITIASAATFCEWRGHHVNIIDTPGHVDFTIEVERSLRVLDGAILVLCGVAGVQSQSLTVDRQMRRYKVPRLAFVNKLDRSGANPFRVVEQLRDKLRHNAVLMQIPIGLESKHEGLVDLVTMKALYFDGPNGEVIRVEEIPAEMRDDADAARETMLDAVSLYSDELTEAILEDKVTEELIHAAVRRGTLSQSLTPVFIGSAYKNKGVQPLLDAVTRYLPSPLDVENTAVDLSNDEAPITLAADPNKPLVALAFKLEDGRYGQLTYLRVYQGRIGRGVSILNARTKRRHKVGRLGRMHADQMEEIEEAFAGDIVAMFGIDCASGDTFTDESIQVAMSSMHVPAPVISLSIKPVDKKAQDNMGKALGRFVREDPTFHSAVDSESGETIISGMGELHLDVYVERMKREYGVVVETGAPQVAYREAISQRAEFVTTHKKQTGGSGQYAKVAGFVEPFPDGDFEYLNEVRGGNVPSEFIPSVEKGVRTALEKGTLIGFPITNLRFVLNDGQAHSVDSSDIAFQIAGRKALREVYPRAKPVVLEPVMKLEVESPAEFQGAILKTVMQRRGTVVGTTEEDGFCRVEAEVPLAEMFGYSTDLRSCTQGKAEFTMEFSRYLRVPGAVQDELIKKYGSRIVKVEEE
ncbi:MAG TPA: elongation factor G [Myxococcota bacterium]|nr:elongation factor G [Myxococcota bacterium]